MGLNTYRPDDNSECFYFEGRIYRRDGIAYLGYTNSSVSVMAATHTLLFYIFTGKNEPENDPSIRIYVNGNYLTDHILTGPGHATYHYEHCRGNEGSIASVRSVLTELTYEEMGESGVPEGSRAYMLALYGFDNKSACVTVLKHTEVAMSHVGLVRVECDGGELTGISEKDVVYCRRTGKLSDPDRDIGSVCDRRTRVEFIGDSITCGYGIHSPLSGDNYTLWDEDGEDNYAAIMAKKMNWDARWISASGYGMYMNYEGNVVENVPKLYPYVNLFLDPEEKIDPKEFEPEFIFINLGTNDSEHICEGDNISRFKESYEAFLRLLKEYHPDAKIICMIGTVCGTMFPYIEEAVGRVMADGYKDIYTLELPFFKPESEGVADGHPTLTTHRKDALRVLELMKNNGLITEFSNR